MLLILCHLVRALSLELLAIDFDKATTVQKEFYFALSENEIPQTFGPKFVKPLEGSNSGPCNAKIVRSVPKLCNQDVLTCLLVLLSSNTR